MSALSVERSAITELDTLHPPLGPATASAPSSIEVGAALGRPVRRWQAAEIESARAENRTPAQAGGWGYRLGGLGTTVMLRGGECLVIRMRGKGEEFAVSMDDAERGAALLNALNAPRPS